MGRILMGVILLMLGGCNAIQALAERDSTTALGGGLFAMFFALAGVALVLWGVEARKRAATKAGRAGRYQCPQCAEWIQRAAKVCPFCKSPVEAQSAQTPAARPTDLPA